MGLPLRAFRIPDDCARDNIKFNARRKRTTYHAAAIEYCRGILETYNAWANGETYAICVAVYDKDGEHIRDESTVGGFYGTEAAEESLEEEIQCRRIDFLYIKGARRYQNVQRKQKWFGGMA